MRKIDGWEGYTLQLSLSDVEMREIGAIKIIAQMEEEVEQIRGSIAFVSRGGMQLKQELVQMVFAFLAVISVKKCLGNRRKELTPLGFMEIIPGVRFEEGMALHQLEGCALEFADYLVDQPPGHICLDHRLQRIRFLLFSNLNQGT